MDNWSWTEPLDSHLFTPYYEYLALIVLQALFPERYARIIKVDKPDLQDAQLGIGIEVVQAFSETSSKIEHLCSQYTYEKNTQKKAKLKQKLEKMGCTFCNDASDRINWPAEINSFDSVVYEFERKLQKLNGGGYAVFLHNELFLYSGVYAFDYMLYSAMKKMKDIEKEFSAKFETVYVYAPEHIYIFNLLRENYRDIGIQNHDQTEWACKARERVECDA